MATLGEYDKAVAQRLDDWATGDYAARLWRKDPTLWSDTPQPELSNRLGWLELPAQPRKEIESIARFAAGIKPDGLHHVVLLGMGGSSLAPEVFQATFGNAAGYPELIVLDSTHPDAVRAVEARIDTAQTLFVVSSKSGTTIETLSFFKYFWNQAGRGEQFVAITDPGSSLEALAREHKFRRIFSAPSQVGGRYSALSVFGIVPAALVGVDIGRLLTKAAGLAEATRAPAKNPGLELGAALGELALAGRDKVTFATSSSLVGFPSWIEQLIAESTGKDQKGIVPVADEPAGEAEVYGGDRYFVGIAIESERAQITGALDALERAGHPVARFMLHDRLDLGAEFFRWETAVAAAGSVLGIHPFNQPDVQLAKDLAKKAMAGAGRSGTGWDDGVTTVSLDDTQATRKALDALLETAKPGDYLALQAYLPPRDETTASLQDLRRTLRDRTRLATTLGYGPRFLHSTGQLHKGGPNTGIFVQFVGAAGEPLAVPETDYGFGDLIHAQALGDAQALTQRGRRLLRIVVSDGGLDALTEVTRE